MLISKLMHLMSLIGAFLL